MTRVNSPLGSWKCWMACVTVPRNTSSCSLVSSRHTAMGRSPSVSPMSRRAALNRCGVSRTTRVRSCAATDASSFSRSARFLGRNPRYTKLSPYMPDTEIAAVGAEGPGDRGYRMPGLCCGLD